MEVFRRSSNLPRHMSVRDLLRCPDMSNIYHKRIGSGTSWHFLFLSKLLCTCFSYNKPLGSKQNHKCLGSSGDHPQPMRAHIQTILIKHCLQRSVINIHIRMLVWGSILGLCQGGRDVQVTGETVKIGDGDELAGLDPGSWISVTVALRELCVRSLYVNIYTINYTT